jgi:hypothetical protein
MIAADSSQIPMQANSKLLKHEQFDLKRAWRICPYRWNPLIEKGIAQIQRVGACREHALVYAGR